MVGSNVIQMGLLCPLVTKQLAVVLSATNQVHVCSSKCGVLLGSNGGSAELWGISSTCLGQSPAHPCASIVSLINRLKMRSWQVQFHHIYRQANQVADWIANYALSIPTGSVILSHPPPGCYNLLWQDVANVYFNRHIRL
ncbi:non-LTR retroelement reverse transcriptase-like [Trifolium medium]|uniref:Non-LTR retroelement reverse transcriptase-like n=1 Tax=Trifolium medium TaxID=97028 RepID=A0A392Q0C8_9FABA|nr:non-LTR retroelement reverse transcriptase-like [Trifolium medium]